MITTRHDDRPPVRVLDEPPWWRAYVRTVDGYRRRRRRLEIRTAIAAALFGVIVGFVLGALASVPRRPVSALAPLEDDTAGCLEPVWPIAHPEAR